MRLFAILMLGCVAGLAQTEQAAEANMACIEGLQMPSYPPLARVANVSGSVTASVVLATDGSVQSKIAGHQLFKETVEKAIQSSTFSKTCASKTVTVIFDFTIDKDLAPTDAQRISFGYPNRFWIVTPNPPLMVSQAEVKDDKGSH